MVTCQLSELGWEVTVELPTYFLSLGRGSVSVSTIYIGGLSTVKNKYLCLEMVFIHGKMHV